MFFCHFPLGETRFPHLAILRAAGHEASAFVAVLVVAGDMAGPGGRRQSQKGEIYGFIGIYWVIALR